MQYEVFEDHEAPGAWRVEAFGEGGECYVTVFAGDDAETRARAYAEWVGSEESVVATPLMTNR